MKFANKIMAFAAAVAFVATGCVKDTPNYKPNNGNGGGESGYTGYLDMTSLHAQVMPDAELQQQSTRAQESLVEVDDSYIVTIFDSNSTPVYGPKSYGELKTETDNMLQLAVGNYNLEVKSADEAEPVSKVDGFYSTDPYVDFSVARTNTKENPAKVEKEVVCKLQSVKVTVELTADLLDPNKGNLTEYKATVSVKEKPEATVDFTEEYIGLDSPAFLDLANRNGENSLDFVLTGMKGVGEENAEATLRRSIDGVKRGEWRKITVSIAYNSKGEVIFDVQISTMVQDDEIDVNSTAGWTEPVLNEGTDLGIIWEDHDLATDVYTTSDIDYDAADGSFTGDAPKLKLLAKNGIKSVLLTVTTTCADFEDVAEDVDLCGTTTSIRPTMYRQLRIAEANATEAILDMNKIMDNFYGLMGEYTFTFKLTDTQDKTATSVFRMTYGAAEDPTITSTIALDTKVPIEEGMTVRVSVASSAPIQLFKVYIISDALTEADLAELGLKKDFDLRSVDESTEDGQKLAKALRGLGFPINDAAKGALDDVDGKYKIGFDISEFMGALGGFPGVHEFKLEVTNETGSTTVHSLVLEAK